MLTDDLPWPELGNVSRGATRGNQGAKGSLGPPDADGRSILQLRVQPGVLAVKLNTKSSEWYRLLDTEVQNALKLTKTYWRKARRRQDYDAKADQDHMELHEWLQQLKDKVMSHLELLMQKGDIQGPPYVMPDGLEFAFMRKFIERQATGIPHNPRLRNLPREERHHISPEDLAESDDAPISVVTSEASQSWTRSVERSPVSHFHSARPPTSNASSSPSWSRSSLDPLSLPMDLTSVVHRVEISNQALRGARDRLAIAKSQSQDSLQKYMSALEAERAAQAEVSALEEQLDDFVNHMARLHNTDSGSSGGSGGT